MGTVTALTAAQDGLQDARLPATHLRSTTALLLTMQTTSRNTTTRTIRRRHLAMDSRRVTTGGTRTIMADRTMSSCNSLRMFTSRRRVRHQPGDKGRKSSGLRFQQGLKGYG